MSHHRAWIADRASTIPFEEWGNVRLIDFSALVDKNLWDAHWENCEKLHQSMTEAQGTSSKIEAQIKGLWNDPRRGP